MFITTPCQGRSILRREENNLPPGKPYKEDRDELFKYHLVQVRLIRALKPKHIAREMTGINKISVVKITTQ